jgi:hypothetical protein
MVKLPVKPIIFVVFMLSVMLLPSTGMAAPQIEILTSHTSFVDSIGYFNVVGEVHNVGDQAANYVGVTATFYNAGNDVVGTWFNHIALAVLLPDRKSPFRVEFVDIAQSALVDHYSLEVEFTPTDSIPKQLEIASHSSSIVIGSMEIDGEVRNTGDSTATYVTVYATCYDEAGNVVQVGGAYANPVDIGVNQNGPFSIWLDYENTDLINSYVLTTESENYALIPEFNSFLLTILAVSLISISLLLYKRKIIKN